MMCDDVVCFVVCFAGMAGGISLSAPTTVANTKQSQHHHSTITNTISPRTHSFIHPSPSPPPPPSPSPGDVVALRLHLPRQARHLTRLHRAVRGADHRRRLRQRGHLAGAGRLPLRRRAARPHRALPAAAPQARRLRVRAAQQDGAGALLRADERAARALPRVPRLGRRRGDPGGGAQRARGARRPPQGLQPPRPARARGGAGHGRLRQPGAVRAFYGFRFRLLALLLHLALCALRDRGKRGVLFVLFVFSCFAACRCGPLTKHVSKTTLNPSQHQYCTRTKPINTINHQHHQTIRSGKLQVVDRVVAHWVGRGHKALLFCQTQQMLDIVEKLAGRRVRGLLFCAAAAGGGRL